MIDTLLALDRELLLFFNGYHSEWLDSLMMIITGKWTWVPLYIVLVGLMFRRFGWKRTVILLVGIALTITLADQICASWIRPAVARLRPVDLRNEFSAMFHAVNDFRPRSYSFPSCHAANTFALATFLTLAFRSRPMGVFIFCWAAIVSISRLYLAVHHPSDVLAGAVIGSLIAWGVYLMCEKIPFGKRATMVGVLLAAINLGAGAQRFEWGGEFSTFFDNREGSAHHSPARTYFLTRLAPEIGVSFRNGTHRVMGGAVWTQPIGCEWDGHRISPTLYYRYRSRNVSGSLGMFPRSQLIRRLPEFLESDSARYFQNNFRGAMLQTYGRNGFFELVVDWRGMQTRKQREAFGIIAQGEWQRPERVFLFGGSAMLNHLAKSKNPSPDQFVIDNLIANPYVGVDLMPTLRRWRHWHALSLRAGALVATTRDRGVGSWLTAVGVRAELDATFGRFSLRNVTWVGNKPLFPLYNKYGTQLNDGEPYFSSKWYNRTEISGLILRYRNIVNLSAELDFHVADGNDFMFYQRLILTVRI